MKYFLIGPYPPPLGGISVFIYRYSKILSSQGQEIAIIDFSKANKFRKVLLIMKIMLYPGMNTFHLNELSSSAMFGLILRSIKSRIIWHDHSGRALNSLSKIKRILFKVFLKKVNQCILVGDHLKDFYIQNNFRLPSNTIVQNAFLPPPLEDEPGIWETYEPETIDFIDSHKPLIIANAFRIAFHNGNDLYGLDMCVELVNDLKKNYKNIGLLFALAEIGEPEYFKKICKRISELGLNDNFSFMLKQKELWPLFKKADLLVRPTSTDGDAVSIREALFFKCPVVASDVCRRPGDIVVFNYPYFNDFLIKVRRQLNAKYNIS
jgi:glycosyltransferase involved in cell wall biosynthesis